MKAILQTFKGMQAFSFLVGIAFGAAAGLMLFSHLVPSGDEMTGLYHYKIAQVQANKNEKALLGTPLNTAIHGAMTPITSEKQFLKEMVAHHEAALLMSRELLTLKNIRPEVLTLAKNIISTQTTEIKIMKDWIAAWKY